MALNHLFAVSVSVSAVRSGPKLGFAIAYGLIALRRQRASVIGPCSDKIYVGKSRLSTIAAEWYTKWHGIALRVRELRSKREKIRLKPLSKQQSQLVQKHSPQVSQQNMPDLGVDVLGDLQSRRVHVRSASTGPQAIRLFGLDGAASSALSNRLGSFWKD